MRIGIGGEKRDVSTPGGTTANRPGRKLSYSPHCSSASWRVLAMTSRAFSRTSSSAAIRWVKLNWRSRPDPVPATGEEAGPLRPAEGVPRVDEGDAEGLREAHPSDEARVGGSGEGRAFRARRHEPGNE